MPGDEFRDEIAFQRRSLPSPPSSVLLLSRGVERLWMPADVFQVQSRLPIFNSLRFHRAKAGTNTSLRRTAYLGADTASGVLSQYS